MLPLAHLSCPLGLVRRHWGAFGRGPGRYRIAAPTDEIVVWALANGAPPYPRASREEEREVEDQYDVDDMGPWDEEEDEAIEEGYGSGWSEEYEEGELPSDEEDMYEDDFADDDDDFAIYH